MQDSSRGNINEEQNLGQDSTYRCPKCRSTKVSIGYPHIRCYHCGWSEPLIDFPISWDWHRHYCRRYGVSDPGPCETPAHTLQEVNERLEALEKRLDQLSDADVKRLGFRHVNEELHQLKLGLRYTQRELAQVLLEKKAAPRKVTKGVAL